MSFGQTNVLRIITHITYYATMGARLSKGAM